MGPFADVWCKAIPKLHTIRDPAALPAWLYTTARRVVNDHLRVTIRHRELLDAEADLMSLDDAAEPKFSASDAEEIHHALGHLSLLHREALTLYFLEGFSLAEIAGIVGAPIGTIKSRLHNAKKALKAFLDKERARHG